MLRPSANAARASAFAAESISASLPLMIGNRIAATVTTVIKTRERNGSAIRASGDVRRTQANDSPIMPVLDSASAMLRVSPCWGCRPGSGRSGFCRCRPAEQAARRKHQDQHQDRKDDYVGPAHFEQLAAQRLDQSDQ